MHHLGLSLLLFVHLLEQATDYKNIPHAYNKLDISSFLGIQLLRLLISGQKALDSSVLI
jgi:hypothetical protein